MPCAVGQFVLALISGLAIYMLWDKYVLPAARHALMVEKLIHTTYTVTRTGS